MDSWPSKDPNEVLDYRFDWTDRLIVAETIATSDFLLESGDIVLASPAVASPFTTIWISGGTVGTFSVVTNRVVTSQGRTYDASARLRIRSH